MRCLLLSPKAKEIFQNVKEVEDDSDWENEGKKKGKKKPKVKEVDEGIKLPVLKIQE